MEAEIVAPLKAGEICVLDAAVIARLPPSASRHISAIVDAMGRKSQIAQNLKTQITTLDKVRASDNRLYIDCGRKGVNGILKVGKKKLFIRNDAGQISEIDPLCVLDFYVFESCQRSGIGRKLFDFMLENERVFPHRLGYDRPSPKLIAFMGKHFGLRSYVPQTNNFVVYKKYFEDPAGNHSTSTTTTNNFSSSYRGSNSNASATPSFVRGVTPSSPLRSPQKSSPKPVASMDSYDQILGSPYRAPPKITVHSPAKYDHKEIGNGSKSMKSRHNDDIKTEDPPKYMPEPAQRQVNYGRRAELHRMQEKGSVASLLSGMSKNDPPSTAFNAQQQQQQQQQQRYLGEDDRFTTSYGKSFNSIPSSNNNQSMMPISSYEIDSRIRSARAAAVSRGGIISNTRPW